MDHIKLRGIGVSPGVSLGEVYLTERMIFTRRKERISASQVAEEMERFEKAILRTRKQLVRIKDEIKVTIGEEHSFIFEAHLIILKDKSMISGVDRIIKEEKVRAEWAISRIHDKYRKIFESIADEYLRERQSDVSDVLSRVYRNLDPTEEKLKKTKGDNIPVSYTHLTLPTTPYV